MIRQLIQKCRKVLSIILEHDIFLLMSLRLGVAAGIEHKSMQNNRTSINLT